MVQESERCDNCGNSYETVYSVDNAVWDKLAGLNICLCPSCADEMARTKGLHPYWEMADGEYPTAKLKAENARLRKTLKGCDETLMEHACQTCDWQVDRCWRYDNNPPCRTISTIKLIHEVLGDDAN